VAEAVELASLREQVDSFISVCLSVFFYRNVAEAVELASLRKRM